MKSSRRLIMLGLTACLAMGAAMLSSARTVEAMSTNPAVLAKERVDWGGSPLKQVPVVRQDPTNGSIGLAINAAHFRPPAGYVLDPLKALFSPAPLSDLARRPLEVAAPRPDI